MILVPCKDCDHFSAVQATATPTLLWIGDYQHIDVVEPDHDGECEHEANWRPSRGNMPCDKDFECEHVSGGKK